MEVSVTEAVAALDAAIQELLPGAPDPALAPEVRINPLTSHLAGIGGVLGLSREPPGEIMARRLCAHVVVRVKAGDLAGVAAAEAQVTNALVGADADGLRDQGIFRLARDHSLPDLVLSAADGLPAGAGKDIRFQVLYEFRKLPEAPSGVIDALPLDLMNHTTEGRPRELFRSEFETDPLALFDPVDDAGASGGPGVWSYDGAEAEVRQSSAIGGGSNNFNASKRGTSLVLRPAAVTGPVRDFVLWASCRSDTGGGIGLVFRWQDENNGYFFIMNRPSPYRLFAKKVGDSLSFLSEGGRDNTRGYELGQWHDLRLLVQGASFDLALDGRTVLVGRDDSLADPGLVGFLCRSNESARFRFLRWVAL